MKLPWSEQVPRFSIHGEAATPREVERLASELMDARADAARWREVAEGLAIPVRALRPEVGQAGYAALARFEAAKKEAR